jgi:predicted NUDIX family NTP pyrophosphohydrolase
VPTAPRTPYRSRAPQIAPKNRGVRMRNDAASSPRLPTVKCSKQECHDHYTEAVSPISAGILLFRRRNSRTEVFLVHPGGPYWAQKESGAWSVPKGLIIPGEEDLECARREFKEETGFDLHGTGNEHDLGIFRQPSGKRLHVWAVEGDCNPSNLTSNLFARHASSSPLRDPASDADPQCPCPPPVGRRSCAGISSSVNSV